MTPAPLPQQLDAFDLFRLQGHHVLMPNMSLACGTDLMTARGTNATRGKTWTTFPEHAACPACLAVPDLRGKAAAMQRRQA